MPSTSVPATRELRGLRLYRERGDEIEHPYPGIYVVPGCSGGSYVVHLAPRERCDCPDTATVCKHIICATIYQAKARARRRSA